MEGSGSAVHQTVTDPQHRIPEPQKSLIRMHTFGNLKNLHQCWSTVYCTLIGKSLQYLAEV
jgi:hypothetical protein